MEPLIKIHRAQEPKQLLDALKTISGTPSLVVYIEVTIFSGMSISEITRILKESPKKVSSDIIHFGEGPTAGAALSAFEDIARKYTERKRKRILFISNVSF